MTDIPLSLLDRRVAHGRYPLGFQAPEHPLHRRIIPTISSPAHALTHAISPKALTKTPASILRALVGVEQQTLRLPSLLVSHVQGLDDQVRIRLSRQRPAHNTAGKKI